MGEKKAFHCSEIYICVMLICKMPFQPGSAKTSDHFHLLSANESFYGAAKPIIFSFAGTESLSVSITLFPRADKLQCCIEMCRDA